MMHIKTNLLILKKTLLLIAFLLTGCAKHTYIYTNVNVQSKKDLNKIKSCIESKNVCLNYLFSKKKYVLLNNKKSLIFIVRNKKDNRLYIGVEKEKYILPIEINCENLKFKAYKNIEEVMVDTTSSHISILLNKEDSLLKIGTNQFLKNNHYGTVCEFKSNNKLDYCIKQKYIYQIDSLGLLNEFYLY